MGDIIKTIQETVERYNVDSITITLENSKISNTSGINVILQKRGLKSSQSFVKENIMLLKDFENLFWSWLDGILEKDFSVEN